MVTLKRLLIIVFLILMMLTNSCNNGGGMPNVQTFNIDRIYSINIDGSNLKLINRGSNFTLLPNGKIYFLDDYKLYSSNKDGSNKLIVSPPDIKVSTYQFFSNYKKVLLHYSKHPFLMNIDGSGLRKLNWVSDEYYHGLAISPEGNKITFSDNSGLFVSNNDGLNKIQIKDTTNRSYSYNIQFTPDGKNILYIYDVQFGVALDLRMYNLATKQDTSIYYNDGGNKIIDYTVSKNNLLLFSNDAGINIENLNNFTQEFLFTGGAPEFNFDSTKITYMNRNFDTIFIYDVKDRTTNQIKVNLPNNFITHPILSPDEKQIYFQADSTWQILNKDKRMDMITN